LILYFVNILKMADNEGGDFFKKFPSIENSYQERYTNAIRKLILSLGYHIQWLVFEKIDGCNFSFIYDGKEMKCAKRTAILQEGEQFFYYSSVAKRYTPYIIDFYEKLGLTEGATITVFGELYGGYYPGVQTENKHINKNIFYSTEIDFMVFDIRINDTDGTERWMPYDEYVQLLENVPIVKPLFRGSFEEALKYQHIFITKIPEEMHGLPEIDGNFAEGVVIKAEKPLLNQFGQPYTLKNKHPKFNERNIPSKTDNKPTLKHPVVAYITEARLSAVVSKMGPVSQADFKRVMPLFTADILEDYRKDNENIDDKEVIDVKKIVGSMACDLVKQFLSKQ
jgi:Rnl2 family RNA ligase